MLPDPTILNSVARVVGETLREVYQLDPVPVFASVGLDYESLQFVRGRYNVVQHQRLWQIAVSAAGDPAFGLRVGERVRPTTFGVLSVAWLASATLRDALRRFARYSRVISTMPHRMTLDEHTQPCWLRFEYPAGSLAAPETAVVALLAAMLTLARMALRAPIRPKVLRLQQKPDGQTRALQEFFGCPIEFEAACDGLAFDDAQLDTLMIGHDTDVAHANDLAAERYLREIDAAPVTAAVRRELAGLLLSGESSLAVVARRMHRGQSTLQRQLQQEGVNFRQVLDQTRRQLAEAYLADARVSLGEIAWLLGFADQSTFSRSFRRWTGRSPSGFREQAGMT